MEVGTGQQYEVPYQHRIREEAVTYRHSTASPGPSSFSRTFEKSTFSLAGRLSEWRATTCSLQAADSVVLASIFVPEMHTTSICLFHL